MIAEWNIKAEEEMETKMREFLGMYVDNVNNCRDLAWKYFYKALNEYIDYKIDEAFEYEKNKDNEYY